MSSPIKVGVISMGDMGAGMAKLLVAHGFRVATNCSGRSEDTLKRARAANVELLSSDEKLVKQCHVILSVVPPRDAGATAQRIIDALSNDDKRERDLYFADLNAVSPSTCRAVGLKLEEAKVPVRFIDGCILGGPPKLTASSTGETEKGESEQLSGSGGGWSRPNIPVSGPHSLRDLPGGDKLESTLNFRNISPKIGAASGLKMCFAAMAKGFTALATQSFTTAHAMGVADELKLEMSQLLPKHLAIAEGTVPGMPPKAYRFVKEMEEISATMSEEGGWGPELFLGAAGIYKDVAEDETLGAEKVGKRKRGTTLEDVAAIMSEGLKRKKTE